MIDLQRRRGASLALAAAMMLASGSVHAHHGWAWTEDEPFELTGEVEEVYVGNPHVTLEVRADDGLWHVDLAPLAATTRAGFDESSAEAGDEVTCIGFRSRDHGQRSMKAARVVVGGKTYDVYLGRVPGT